MDQTVTKSYSYRLVVTLTLVIVLGALLIGSILYLSLHREEAFYSKSHAIFTALGATAFLLIVTGTAIFSLLYSHKVADMEQTISKTYAYRLVPKCILIILLGTILIDLTLYLSMYRGSGLSYSENYAILSALRKELFYKSLLVYATASLFVIAGITAISLLYSHRVAGPLYRVNVVTRDIASGDLGRKVVLREHDLLHPIADDLNALMSAYGEILRQVAAKKNELKEGLSEIHVSTGSLTESELRHKINKLSGKADEIKGILSQIKS